METKELLDTILSNSSEHGKPTLLSALHAYDQVLSQKKLSKNSEIATEAYRYLLEWGRDRQATMEQNFRKEFEEELTLKDLESSRTKSQDPPSFDGRNAGKFVRKSQSKEREVPTRDNALGRFRITLPKFKDFHSKLKESQPEVTMAQAFRGMSLKRRSWAVLKEAKEQKRQTKIKLNRNKKTKKVLAAWKSISKEEVEIRKAYEFLLINTLKKTFEAISKYTLVSVRKNISEKIADAFFLKKIIKEWKKARREIKKKIGMEFTMDLVYNNGLLKKCLTGLVRYVHENMTKKVLMRGFQMKRVENIYKKALCFWENYVLEKIKGKILYKRGYEASLGFYTREGMRRFKLFIERSKEAKMKKESADEHFKTNKIPMIFEAWSLFKNLKIYNENMRRISELAYLNSLKKRGFQLLLEACEILEKNEDKILLTISSNKLYDVFQAWKEERKSKQVETMPGHFYFAAYKMTLRYPFAEDKPGFIPVIFPIKRSRYYEQATSSCGNYILKKIISYWRADSLTFKTKEKKFFLNRLKKLFEAFRKITERSNYYKYVLKKQSKKRNNPKVLKIIKSWLNFAIKKKNLFVSHSIYSSRKIQSTKSHFFSMWNLALQEKEIQYLNKHKAEKHLRTSTLTNSFKIWRSSYTHAVRKEYLNHLSNKFQFFKLLNSHWNKWRNTFIRSISLDFQEEKILTNKDQKIKQKIFKTWSILIPTLIRSNVLNRKANNRYAISLAVKVFAGLERLCETNFTKKRLYGTIDQERNRGVKRNVLKALHIHSEYRQKARLRDKLLYPQLFSIRKRTLFTGWYNLMILFNNCKIFNSIFEDIEKRVFLEKLVENVRRQEVTIAYLEEFRNQGLQKTVLKTWKRFIEKKKNLIELEQDFQERRLYFKLLGPFMDWRRKYVESQRYLFVIGKAVLEIAKEYKRKTMDHWLLYLYERKRSKYIGEHRLWYLKRMSFQSWKKMFERKQEVSIILERSTQKRKRIMKNIVVNRWAGMNRKKEAENRNIKKIEKKILGKFLKKWVEAFDWNLYEKESYEKIFELKRILSFKKTFEVFRKYLKNRKIFSELLGKAESFNKELLMKKSIKEWVIYRGNSAKNKTKLQKFEKKVDRRELKDFFGDWLSKSYSKIIKMRVTKKLEIIYNKNKEKGLFFLWIQRVKSKKYLEELNKFYNSVLDSMNLRKIIKYWQTTIINQKEKSEKTEKHKKFWQKIKFNLILLNWKKITQRSKHLKQIEKSLPKISRENLIKKCFSSQKSQTKSARSTREKLFNFQTKSNKNKISLFFSKLFEISTRQKEAKSLKKYSNQIFSHNCLLKSFNQLILYAYSQKRKTEKEVSAVEHYGKNLIKKIYLNWASLTDSNEILKSRILTLLSAIQTPILRASAYKAFYLIKSLFEKYEKEILNKSASLKSASMKRLLQGWLKEARIISNLGLKEQIVERKNDSSCLREFLAHWRFAYRHSFTVKKFEEKEEKKALSCFFESWRQVLLVKEFEKKKELMLMLKSFKSLENYAEITHEGVEALRNFRNKLEYSEFVYVLSSWKESFEKRKQAKKIGEKSSKRVMERLMENWKEFIEEKKLNESVGESCDSIFIGKFYKLWKQAYQKRIKRYEILQNLITKKEHKILRNTTKEWLEIARLEYLEELVFEEIVAPKEIAKLSNLLQTWKKYTQHKKQKQETIKNFRASRSSKDLSECFKAWRVQFTLPLPVSSSKLAKLFSGWRAVARRYSEFKSITSKIQKLTRKSLLKKYALRWEKKMDLKYTSVFFKEKLQASNVKRLFNHWIELYFQKNKQQAAGYILALSGMLAAKRAIQKWVEGVETSRINDSKALEYQDIRITRYGLIFFGFLRRKVYIRHRVTEYEERRLYKWSRKMFSLFIEGCENSLKNRNDSLKAEIHSEKYKKLIALYGWRLWFTRRFETHVLIEENMLTACSHYRKRLMAKAFYGWETEITEFSFKRRRSVLHTLFSAWKIYARENVLLKKYLKESNLPEKYLRTSRDIPNTPRDTLRSISSLGSLASD